MGAKSGGWQASWPGCPPNQYISPLDRGGGGPQPPPHPAPLVRHSILARGGGEKMQLNPSENAMQKMQKKKVQENAKKMQLPKKFPYKPLMLH